jgi:hypothetical protein
VLLKLAVNDSKIRALILNLKAHLRKRQCRNPQRTRYNKAPTCVEALLIKTSYYREETLLVHFELNPNAR